MADADGCSIHTHMKSPSDNLPAVVERPMQPLFPSVSPVPYAARAEMDAEPDAPLSHYLLVLKLHRWKMLGFIALSVIATGIASSRLVPIYEATATIDIDRQSPPGIIGEEARRSAINGQANALAAAWALALRSRHSE